MRNIRLINDILDLCAQEFSLDSLVRSRTSVWDILLGKFCSRSFAWDLAFGSFRVILQVCAVGFLKLRELAGWRSGNPGTKYRIHPRLVLASTKFQDNDKKPSR